MSETWVQEYPEPMTPGPDGQPFEVSGDMEDVRDLLVTFHAEYHPKSQIITRITRRSDRTQQWRRVNP